MKSTLFTMYLFITFISFLHVAAENIRFTITGRRCVFPIKHNGIEYLNCLINEKGQEWCYTDNLGISWNYCARGNFGIDSSILIKNIQTGGEDKTNSNIYCLFHDILRKKLFSTDCSILLQIKKHKIDKSAGLDTNNFEFFWINHSQIKTKEGEKCLHPVETPIIEESKIAYTGFIEIKDCIIADDLKNNNEQKWKIDENGRILNEFSKRCLVRSTNFTKFSEKFVSIKLDFDFDIFSVNLGDCIGNAQGFQGREIWLLDEFRTELLELMALNKLMKVYSEGNQNIEKIGNLSNKNFLKIINYTSNLIGHRKILDNIENKLEIQEKNLDNLNIDKRFNLFNLDKMNKNFDVAEKFNVNGVLFSMSENFDLKPGKYFIADLPMIQNSEILIMNFLDLFQDDKRKENMKKYNIENQYKILKLSGFLINNREKYIKFKVESNAKFQFILNSKIILNTDYGLDSIDSTDNFASESVKILSRSLNEFSIIILNPQKSENKKLNFKFDIIHIDSKTNNLIDLSSSSFIPIMPGSSKLTMKKSDFISDLHIIDCKEKLENLSQIIKNKSHFYCDRKCFEQSTSDSICKNSFLENKLTPLGGLINIVHNKNTQPETKRMDMNMLGFDLIINEVKFGYIREFNNYSEEIKSAMLRNYIVQINPRSEIKNPDDSFLFYKKSIPKDLDQLILINAKLICDNSNNNSNTDFMQTNADVKIEIEKIHDMINGFAIWLFKIKYRDYLKLVNSKSRFFSDNFRNFFEEVNTPIPFVDELRLDIVPLSDIENNYDPNNFHWDTKYNKYVCAINNKNILFRVKFKSNTEIVENIIDYHADFNTKFEELNMMNKNETRSHYLIKCSENMNINSAPNLEKIIDIKLRFKLVCVSAYDKGLITKNGGIFKIINNKNKSMELESVTGLPTLKILQNKYRIFWHNPQLMNVAHEFVKNMENISMSSKPNTNGTKNLSSFLQIGSTESSAPETLTTSKFYSNDLLLKLEQGLNRITDKIIDSSKKISDVTKINEDLESKIKKIEVGENSLDVITKRIEEISKLEMNLEDRVNKKFDKYREILIEKDKKIKDLTSDRFNTKNSIYDIQQRAEEFYGDWLIVDSLNSVNGPSDWYLKRDESNGRYILSQNSSIKQANIVEKIKSLSQKIDNNSLIASSLILNNFSLKHLHTMYTKIVFQSKSSGLIQLNFRYKDYQNYISLQLERKSNEEGFIKLIKLSDNVYSEIENLPCDKMISVLEKCYGYHTDDKENIIELFYLEDNLVIKYNNFVIFRVTNINKGENNNYDDFHKFVISINNQNNLIISDLILRELKLDEKSQIKISNSLSKKDIEQIPEKKEIINPNKITPKNKTNSEDKVEKTNQLKKNLKYNPLKNKFENQSEIESQHDLNLNANKSPELVKENFKQKCSKFEKEEYVCNYLSHIVSSHKININEISVVDLVELIRTNCITMMKNYLVCDQILKKLEPLIHKLKNDQDYNSQEAEKKIYPNKNQIVLNQEVKREISNLIKACSFDFLPNLLKNRKICLNDIMKKELQSRNILDKTDKCVKEFCINCCYINYGNPSCKVCD